ncbi:hypothetical protein Q1695_007956 [Nippostrongylus brasiliensis]|nr:hypothetical protein Q1695_007956 [Nippostrongylus brasiliensis]
MTREKVDLRFIEKANRQRPSWSVNCATCDVPNGTNQSNLGAMACVEEMAASTAPYFGIGELVQEFSSLTTSTPPPTPASASSGTFSLPDENDNVARTLSETIAEPPIGQACPLQVTTNEDLADPFGCCATLQLVAKHANGTETSHSSSTSGFCDNMFCSTTSVTEVGPSAPPAAPRSVRRFQYWCRVLQTKRRRPMCRFCYERYVHMCIDMRRPIPASYDRGMWHGHNMKERGVVTCPHLYATTCSYCGATGQNAHTDDYCPLRRNEAMLPHSGPLL